MLRRDEDSVFRVALDLGVSGKRKRGRLQKRPERSNWKRRQRRLAYKTEDALNR